MSNPCEKDNICNNISFNTIKCTSFSQGMIPYRNLIGVSFVGVKKTIFQQLKWTQFLLYISEVKSKNNNVKAGMDPNRTSLLKPPHYAIKFSIKILLALKYRLWH